MSQRPIEDVAMEYVLLLTEMNNDIYYAEWHVDLRRHLYEELIRRCGPEHGATRLMNAQKLLHMIGAI